MHEFLCGAGFSDSPHLMYSGDKNGEWYQLYMIGFGGVPGKPMGWTRWAFALA